MSILIIIAAVGLFVNGTQGAHRRGQKQPDYLTIVKVYADAMIKDGRDTSGTTHSPLFASALDRHMMQIGDFQNIDGVRNADRFLSGTTV